MSRFDLGEDRKARAAALVDSARSDLMETAPDFLARFPLQAHIDELENHGALSRFFDASPAFNAQVEAMEAAYPASSVELYNRLLLAHLIKESETRNTHIIPDSIVGFVHEDFDRILKALGRPRKGYYLRRVHLFRRDVAMARMKVIAAGSEFIDINVGIGRGAIVRQAGGGASAVANCARTFGLDFLKGMGPVYEPHWDRRYIRHFNPEGYRAFYLRTAEMMRANPDVVGMYSSSWWYDEALNDISPNLSFLRQHPAAGGARFLDLHGPNPQRLVDPFSGSPERKALYEQGLYEPRDILYYWSRSALLRWASAQAENAA